MTHFDTMPEQQKGSGDIVVATTNSMAAKDEETKSRFRWRVHDTDSPPEIYNRRLYLSILVFGVLGSARGYDEGNILGSQAQVSFQTLFGLNDPNKTDGEKASIQSNIAAMVQLGSIGGAIISMFLVDKIGKIRSLQFICVSWIIATIIQITSESVGQLYAGRLLEGVFAIGITTTVGPSYMSEVTPKKIRGMANCIFAGAVYLGIMLGYFANYGTALHNSNDSRVQWVGPTSVKIVLAGLLLIGSFCFCIESPRWHIKTGNPDKALECLCKLRKLPGDHPFIIGEIADINEQVQFEKEAKKGNKFVNLVIQIFAKKSLRYRFFAICCLMQILGQWSGANSVTIYAPELFRQIGIEGIEKLKMTAILGVVKFTSAYISAFFIIDFFGRRKALYTGISIQLVCLLYFATFMAIVPEAADEGVDLVGSTKRASKGAMAALFLSGCGWTIGFNSMQYLIGSEVFPLHIRSFAQSCIMVLHFANQYGNSKALPKMMLSMQPFGAFYFFVGVNLIAITWAFFFIPELSGRSLESMEELFNLPWYLIGRKGHILCPDYSEVNKNHDNNGEIWYNDADKTSEQMRENISVHRDSEEKDDKELDKDLNKV